MIICKRCQSEECVRNGEVRGKQRYKCGVCGLNFVVGDGRSKPFSLLRKALAVLFYRLSNAPGWMLTEVFGVSNTMIWRWIEEFEARLEQAPDAEMRMDLTGAEVMKYLSEQKAFWGTKKRWVVARGEVCPGYKAIIIMRRENAAESLSELSPTGLTCKQAGTQ